MTGSACTGDADREGAGADETAGSGSMTDIGEFDSLGTSTGSGPASSDTTNTGNDDGSTGVPGTTSGGGTDVDGGSGQPPRSSATWVTMSYSCDAEGLLDATSGLDTDFVGGAYIYGFVDERLRINGGGGAASGIRNDGTWVVSCGSANAHPLGTEVRAALARPGNDPAGAPLRWEVFELTCPVAAEDLPSGLSLDVVAATYATRGEDDAQWNINPSDGWSAGVLADGTLDIPCGTGNNHPDGTSVRVALGFDDGAAAESLDWTFYEFTCETSGLHEAAVGIDTAFAAVTYIANAGERWSLHPLSGLSSHLADDGRLLIACGDQNDHDLGTTVRVGFGYE